MGKIENPVRPPGASVRQLPESRAGNRSSGGHVQAYLPRAGGPQVWRLLSDEDAVLDDPRSGNRQPDTDQRLRVLPQSRYIRGLRRGPADEQPVFHAKPAVEDHQEQTEPGVHIGQAQADVRPDQSVRRRDDGQYSRKSGARHRRDGRARHFGEFRDRRHRHLCVRAQVERY